MSETKASSIKVPATSPISVAPTVEECFKWLGAYADALEIHDLDDVNGRWEETLKQEWQEWKMHRKSTRVSFEACDYVFTKDEHNNVTSKGEC